MTVRLLVGDCRAKLKELPDNSVHVCVTSPPYLGLRDYGTAQWDGGDPDCDHRIWAYPPGRPTPGGRGGSMPKQETVQRERCRKCGATRVDGQIGLEGSLAEFLDALVGVFREVKRVLHPTGTLWVNMGDSYAGGGDNRQGIGSASLNNGRSDFPVREALHGSVKRATSELKTKDLMLVPARLAIALVDDGWWLRAENVWAKPNPMPESVRDRTTRAHEFVYMFAKQPKYFYDATAVAEAVQPMTSVHVERYKGRYSGVKCDPSRNDADNAGNAMGNGSSRNLRSVWTITPEPYSGAHFAVFPREIPRRCIRSGSSEKGCCPACLSPWRRTIETGDLVASGPNGLADKPRSSNRLDFTKPLDGRPKDGYGDLPRRERQTTGWEQTCTCPPHQPQPCVVLDPFSGAGTTGLVADELGRDAVLIELNESYAQMARDRIYGASPLFATVGVE